MSHKYRISQFAKNSVVILSADAQSESGLPLPTLGQISRAILLIFRTQSGKDGELIAQREL